MKVVIAPDSFKESLTAKEVCQAIESGFRRVWADSEFVHVPVADGGEGTVQSLVDATQGKLVHLAVTGPLGNSVDAFYGLLGDNQTAVIEMAAASGLHHVSLSQRDPKLTTSFGTGQLINHALEHGARKLIIGLGGSATNDGGVGMMAALGAKFLNQNGQPIALNGGGLSELSHIDLGDLNTKLAECEILVACDVDNPLCGTKGASATFGPQKGATEADIRLLDNNLNHYGQLIRQQLGRDVLSKEGAGAAGGMGAALLAFTDAKLQPGIDIVLETVNLKDQLHNADLVITGEGRIDWQTAHGKTPMGVAVLAKQFDLPVIALAGCVGENYQAAYQCGIDAVFAAVPRALDLSTAFQEAGTNLTNLSENVARLWSVNLAK
ncbi:glycerate kinase [Vibrio nigripulchritudo]|uniref:glycerate kinase n=1 Tax=Vibrio nigripulchritudo TaxID=28173 RepID=UPI00249058FE|nr:glycerate kinase [Vibrio nigripulchritudo]BDU38267.1 glycerate kinase [Vibrio nigripulchritudo]BDU43989.1 glycerate kinase [Vibrio nigripulchritudo]